MSLKKYTEFNTDESCVFCGLRETDVLYGPIYKCRTKYKNKPIVLHYYCLLLASKIDQNGRDNQGILGFFPKDIIKELGRGNSLRCCYCSNYGATVHCIFKSCGKIFHLPCGIKKGSVHQFFNLFDSYCHVHRLKQSIPQNILKDVKDSCIICSVDIDKRNKLEYLWPVCCKPAVLIHRRCIQSMALNAGYYFKCPLCNNEAAFKKEMLRMGIHVPEQDASWELEPNAYEELRVRGTGCEIDICICPKGRDFDKKNTAWQVELCQVCGGNGVHLGCADKWDKNRGFLFNWFCKICKSVYKENQNTEIKNEAVAESTPTNSLETNLASENPETSLNTLRLRSGNIPRISSDAPPADEPIKSAPNNDSDDDIIVVSEDEEDSKPVIHPPNPLVLTHVEEKPTSGSPVQHKSSSDDDVEIVDVVPNKRKCVETPLTRKRFRTAHWQYDENKLKDKISGPSTLANSLITIPKGNIFDTPAKNQLYLQTHPGILNLPAASTSESTTKQQNNVLKQSEGISLPSNIPLKFTEVSINRIVPKPPLKKTNNETIDLSSDDECEKQTPAIQKQSALKILLQQTTQSKSNFFNLCEKLVNKKLETTLLHSNISKVNSSIEYDSKINIPSCSIQQSNANRSQQSSESSNAVKMNSSIFKQFSSFQVILSSDEDEDDPPSCNVKTPLQNISNTKTSCSTQFTESNNSLHFQGRDSVDPSTDANDSSRHLILKQANSEITYSKKEEPLPTPKTKDGVNMASTSSYLPTGSDSILHGVLTMKPTNSNAISEVFIVSDDDDDDMTRPSLEKQLSNDPLKVKELPFENDSKSDFDEFTFSSSDCASSVVDSGICIITGSMSLIGTEHAFPDFDEKEEESSLIQYEGIEKYTEDMNCSHTIGEVEPPCKITSPIPEESSHIVPTNVSDIGIQCSNTKVVNDIKSSSDKVDEVFASDKNPINQDMSISSSTDSYPVLNSSRNEVNTQTDA